MHAWLMVAAPLALLDLGVRLYINAHLAHGCLTSGFIGSMSDCAYINARLAHGSLASGFIGARCRIVHLPY